MSTTLPYVTLNVTSSLTDVMMTTSATKSPSFVALLTITMVVGLMFGTTIVVVILVSLWPRRKRRRRTENIQMQDLDSVYAELDNKSMSTTITRVTSEYSLDSADYGAYSNGVSTQTNGDMSTLEKTKSNKKVRFSDHKVEIPMGYEEPNGIPRHKLNIDVL